MSNEEVHNRHLTEEGVQEELQRQLHLLMRLAENAFVVAESLRGNYFKNTAHFVADLRSAIHLTAQGERPDPILITHKVKEANWASLQGEVVTFIDGGVGRVQLSSQFPILLRVGSYCVRTGERQLSEREQFGYYPVILGDLQGGSKERKDFVDIVRITAELLGGLSALERTPDLRVLMFHGPLIYTVWHYMGHSPFTEHDIDLFLHHYAPDGELNRQIKEEFFSEAEMDIYPQMTDRSDEWIKQRLFEPLAWMAFLYRRLIRVARQRNPIPIIAGVVEREGLSEFSESVLLDRVFRGLRKKGKIDYFNEMYGQTGLTSPSALLRRLNYTGAILLSMLLDAGQFSEPWKMSKGFDGLRREEVALPGESWTSPVNFAPLSSKFRPLEAKQNRLPLCSWLLCGHI